MYFLANCKNNSLEKHILSKLHVLGLPMSCDSDIRVQTFENNMPCHFRLQHRHTIILIYPVFFCYPVRVRGTCNCMYVTCYNIDEWNTQNVISIYGLEHWNIIISFSLCTHDWQPFCLSFHKTQETSVSHLLPIFSPSLSSSLSWWALFFLVYHIESRHKIAVKFISIIYYAGFG